MANATKSDGVAAKTMEAAPGTARQGRRFKHCVRSNGRLDSISHGDRRDDKCRPFARHDRLLRRCRPFAIGDRLPSDALQVGCNILTPRLIGADIIIITTITIHRYLIVGLVQIAKIDTEEAIFIL